MVIGDWSTLRRRRLILPRPLSGGESLGVLSSIGAGDALLARDNRTPLPPTPPTIPDACTFELIADSIGEMTRELGGGR